MVNLRARDSVPAASGVSTGDAGTPDDPTGSSAHPLLAVLACSPPAARGGASARPGSIEAVVTDQTGKPVVDAVVSLTPVGIPPALRPTPAVMDQVNKEFVPSALPSWWARR